MVKRALEPMKIPVTILTGFLGSGKTTLLNHLLTENHGKKFAIIENEFGEVGVDDQLLRKAAASASAAAASNGGSAGDGGARAAKFEASEQILTMNNGCICCTVRGDLVRMIHQILRRVGDRGSLDGIIIETTGMADPSPVVQTFFAEPSIALTCKLDGIITVVDAKHILQHLEPGCGVESECEEQIAFADRLLLNKTDLVSSDELVAIRKRIRDINGTVGIIECQQCRVDPELLLNVQTFDLNAILTKRPEFLKDTAKEDGKKHEHHDHAHGKHSHGSPSSVADNEHAQSGRGQSDDHALQHVDDHGHHHHEHKHGIGSLVSSVGMTSTEPTMLALLEDWIEDLLEEHGEDLLRYKGVISVAGVDRKYVFQGVHTLFYGRFSDPWAPDEKRESRFVFIGKNLDREMLTDGFRDCCAKPLRFHAGDRVLARVQPGGFQDGVVVRQWDNGNPYLIRLERTDRLVWAFKDDDELVRAREAHTKVQAPLDVELPAVSALASDSNNAIGGAH